MTKALYGMLESALRFYEMLCTDLEKNGLKVDPYEACVANKIANGEQMTITWHVDDLKIFHKDRENQEIQKLLAQGIWQHGDWTLRKSARLP